MKRTIYKGFSSLGVRKLLRTEECTEEQNPCDSELEQRQAFVLCDSLHKLQLLLYRPVVRSTEVILVPLGETSPEVSHALHDPRCIVHDTLCRLFVGLVERVDNVGLDIRDGMREFKVVREVIEGRGRGACGARDVGISRGNAKWSSKKNRGPPIVDEHDAPQSDSRLTFLLSEDGYHLGWSFALGHLARWYELGCWVMMEAKFDGEPNETSNETPQCSSLTLERHEYGTFKSGPNIPRCRDTNAEESMPEDWRW